MVADLTQPTWTSTITMTNLSTASNDNTAVWNAYINAASPYTKFIVPAGTYLFSQNIDIAKPNIGVFGASNNTAGCVFKSTSQTQHGYRVLSGANGHWLKGLTHTVARNSGTGRGDQNEQGMATLLVETGVTGFRAEDCLFQYAVAASAFFYGCSDYQLNRCTVDSSLADGFHNTNGSHGGRFYDCRALNTGDDAFAVVQYGNDSASQVSYDIQFIRPYSTGSKARGVSAICVHDITIQDAYIVNSYSPGIYIGREGNNTQPQPCYNISLTGTTILTGCCTGTDQGSNGSFFLLNSDNTSSVYAVTVANCAIVNSPATNNGCVRALTYGNGVITASLSNFKFYGTTPTSSGLPQVLQNVAGTQSTLTTTGWEALTAGVNGNYSGTVHPASQAPAQATAPGATTISAVMGWNAPTSNGGSAVTGYVVTRDGVDTFGSGAVNTTVAASATSYTFSNLVSGSTYHLTVAAVNALGTGTAVPVTVTP